MGEVKKCIVISGMSGAGKSIALKILEDRGFFATDNLPPVLMPQLMEVLTDNGSAVETGVAIVADVRGEALFEDLSASLEALKKQVRDVSLIFLDASDDWLVCRYETTRRRHPLGMETTILESIAEERTRLSTLRDCADVVVDTSSMLPNDLRNSLLSELDMNEDPLTVIVSSFGFKNGIPKDCDYLFDVRFLPNPNYVPELKELSGKDLSIQEYLNKVSAKRVFAERVNALLEFVLVQYEKTGKRQIHIAVGCTGGRHRSVAMAEEVSQTLLAMGHRIVTHHRDIDREGT